MSKVFGGIKKGAADASASAAIEARLLKAKQSGYDHPPEVEEQMNIMRANRDEIPKLKAKLSTFIEHQKHQADAEDRAGQEFTHQSTQPGQHPTLAQILTIYGDSQSSIGADRHVYVAALEAVREEWKQLEAQDLHQISKKQDAANRNIITYRYWEGRKEHEKAEPFRVAYEQNVADFVTQVQDLREKKEELEPQFILRCIQSEVLFLRSALQHAEQCEAAIRRLGPVTPVRFTGWRGLGGGGASYDTHSSSSTPHYEEPAYSAPVQSYGSVGGLSPPPPRPAPSGPQARALYPFTAGSPQELSFQPGDILNVRSQDGAWWQAELNGAAGLIPSNYVELI